MKYFIKTFGCQMNEADSEKIRAWYESRGWKEAKSIDEADEIIINTCSVRESAEHRVMGLIRNIKKTRSKIATPDKYWDQKSNIKSKSRIILTGCMLYHGTTTLKQKMPRVDEFKPIKEFHLPATNYQLLTTKLVPIMEGCNNFCTYCVVPYSRGKEISRPFDEIFCEVEEMAKRGVKEIMLLGQNVNSYGQDLLEIGDWKLEIENGGKYKTPFAILLASLNDVSGLDKISFMTSNPWDLTDDIIKAMKLPKIDRYLHLPVQSGDDEILFRMNRHYTAQNYINLVKKIRRQIPTIKIGTDIIVGFPGETEEQFQHTVDLCKKVGFIKAYIARYSPRPGTAAYKLKDDVPAQEKKKRWQILERIINKSI